MGHGIAMMTSEKRTGLARALAIIALLAAGGCATTRIPPLPPDMLPPVVAVSSFENRSGFSGEWKLGSGMADLLVAELVDSRNFVVVERGQLDKVVDELSRQKNKLFRPEGRVDEGRLINARYLIRGTINDFAQVGGSSAGIALRRLIFGGRGHTARVALTLTLVEIESGRIVGSVNTHGLARAGEAYAQARYKDISFGGDSFFRTPLGTATALAIRRGVAGLVRSLPHTPWRPMVAEIAANGHILINGGDDRGIHPGDEYEVRGPGRPLTDPATGDILALLPGPRIGRIRVSNVGERLAEAEIIEGQGFARGQILLTPDSP